MIRPNLKIQKILTVELSYLVIFAYFTHLSNWNSITTLIIPSVTWVPSRPKNACFQTGVLGQDMGENMQIQQGIILQYEWWQINSKKNITKLQKLCPSSIIHTLSCWQHHRPYSMWIMLSVSVIHQVRAAPAHKLKRRAPALPPGHWGQMQNQWRLYN